MIDFLIALRRFCVDCHSGQWSQLYRVSCLCDRYLSQWYQIDLGRPYYNGRPLTENQLVLYQQFEGKYQ